MPNIAEISPLAVESQYAQARKEAAWRRENRPDIADLGTAALLQGPVAAVFGRISQSPWNWEKDPGFTWNDKLFEELTAGVDPEYWPQFADAVSYKHAAFIRAMAQNRTKYRDQLAAAGTSGTAASVIASLADPIYLGAGLASGGLGFAGGGGKIAQIARAGLLTSAAFAGIEDFKAAVDPKIKTDDVVLAGLAGGLTTVAGALSVGLPRYARFPIGGAAAAAPGTAYAALTSDEVDRSRDIMLNFLPQFFIGGTLASLHPAVRDMSGKLDAAARKAYKDTQYDVVKEQAAAVGKKAEDILSDQGKQYFSGQREGDRFFGDLQQALRSAEIDEVAHPFMEALDRLKSFPEEKRFNRSEVTEILEGTGYKAANQGFPSPSEMRAYIEGMLSKKSPLTFEDRQRLFSQHEAEVGVIRQVGEPTEVAPAKFSVGAATPAELSTPVKPVGPQASAQFTPRDFNLDGVGSDPASFQRFSMAGMASRSEATEIARAANMMGRDDLPKQGGKAVYSAREQVRDWNEAEINNLLESNQTIYSEYVDAEREAGRRPLPYHDFMEEAGKAYRNPISRRDPFVDRAINHYRQIRKGDLERAKLYGVPGALATESDPHLLDRMTVRDKLDEAILQHGLDKLIKWAAESVGSHPDNVDLTPQQQMFLGRDYIINAGRQRNTIDIEEANFLRTQTDHAIAQRLRADNPDITDGDIEAILYKKTELPDGESTGKGNPPKFRRQIRMDTSMAHQIEPGKIFRFDDIIDNNLERIAMLNIKQVNGLAAMGEIYRQFSTPERPINSYPELRKFLTERAVEQGLHSSAYETDLKRLDMMAKIIMGHPLGDNTLWNRSMRILRNYSFARVINPVTALRNFFEIGNALAEPGLKAIAEQIPQFGEFIAEARSGVLRSQLAKELTQAGIGLKEINHRVMPGAEEGDLYLTPKERQSTRGRIDSLMHRAEKGSRRLANFVSSASLMGPTQSVLQRIIGKLASQKLFDQAFSGKALSASRLAALGIHDSMWTRIRAQMGGKDGAHYEKTVFGNTLRGFNWDKWKDVEAAAALRQAISKMSRRLVFKPDPTQMSMWMENDTARTLMQFRHYATGAYESKTLFNVSMRDRTSYLSLVSQLVSKSIAYVLGTYLYAIGRKDREKYLRERLDPAMVAKAAFGQAEITSLIPLGIDIFRQGVGLSPYFAFSRSTGLGQQPGLTGLLTSSASLDTIDKLFGAAGVPAKKLWGYIDHSLDRSQHFDPRVTQKDARTIFGGTPMQNMVGWKQIIEAQIRKLPKERK